MSEAVQIGDLVTLPSWGTNRFVVTGKSGSPIGDLRYAHVTCPARTAT